MASPRSPPATVLFLAPSPRPSPRRTGKFGTAPSSPMWSRPCTAPPRRAVSSSPLCNLTGVRPAPPLPSPRPPIKGPPRAPLSPAPASATHLPPHPSNRASAAVFFPSGKPFSIFSLPLWWFSEKLDRLISCATPPRAWDATPLPQSPHEPHRRRLPPWSSATSLRSAPS
jgi:hypothetical protein